MAKKSQKRQLHHERGHAGCMWGLISIFDFRHGRSTQKLLSDRKHGSARHAAGAGSSRNKLELRDFEENNQEITEEYGTKTMKADIGKTRVKKLMEEDMSTEQQQTKKQIPAISQEQIQADSECGGHVGKNHKQIKETCKASCDIDIKGSEASASLESSDPYGENSFEQFSPLDLAALMEEFCNQIHHRQEIHMRRESMGNSCDVLESTNGVKRSPLDELDTQLVQKHAVLQEKLSEAAEAFLNQKFIDRHQSKLFMDALDILNSNKELLVRLLKDSNSGLVKDIQDPQDHQSEKVEHNKSVSVEEISISGQGEEIESHKQVTKHNIQNIFRRIKSQSRNPSKGNDRASNRIVVLKPDQTCSRSSMTTATSTPNSSPQSLDDLRNQGPSGRFNSQFSLSEIKRKLKHAMGENRKERRPIFMDGVLHRIPTKRHDSENARKEVTEEIVGRELPTIAHHQIEEEEKPSVSGRSADEIGNPTHSHSRTDHEVTSTSALSSTDLTMRRGGYPNHRVSNIYIEAKKHLAEMLSNGDVDGEFSNQHIPRTLGRILSLPEYDFSPVFSPGKDKQHGFVTAQMRFSPNGKFRIINENMWWPKPDSNANLLSPSKLNQETQQCSTDNENPDVEVHELHTSTDTVNELLPDVEIDKSTCAFEGESSPTGNAEEIDVASSIEDNFVNEPSESDSRTSKIEEEEELSKCLAPDSPRNGQLLSTTFGSLSSDSLFIQKGESLESISTPERPSPVSVLEPIFSEDFNSPTSFVSQSAELPMQPLPIHFEEDDCSTLVVTHTDTENYSRNCTEHRNSILEYVTTVLQASNLNLDESAGKLPSSEQLLDPSLFDEVEVLSSQLCGDRKLLFDSTNEVLVEVCERYFGCSPWVGFVYRDIRPAPVGKGVINEVWEGINCHLVPHLLPRSLDQIVGKDMEKERMWMDFRPDTEGIGIEIAELILEELVGDTILDLCS